MPACRRLPPQRVLSTRSVRGTRWTRYLVTDDRRPTPSLSYQYSSSSITAPGGTRASRRPQALTPIRHRRLRRPSTSPPALLSSARPLRPLPPICRPLPPSQSPHSPPPAQAAVEPAAATPPGPPVALAREKGPVGGPGTGLIRHGGPAFAFSVWRRRRKAVHSISEAEDLTLSCIQVLGQFNKKLARLHYLLMFLGLPEKSTKKLQEELSTNRRGCMEMCWHIRDNLFSKMTRAAMQGEATTYVRVLTDCLEMYAKELSILSNLHTDTLLETMQSSPSSTKKKAKPRGQKVHPSTNNEGSEDPTKSVLDTERQEVLELLQMILNKLTARTDEDKDQPSVEQTSTSTSTSTVISIRKAVRPIRLFPCCDCICADDYR